MIHPKDLFPGLCIEMLLQWVIKFHRFHITISIKAFVENGFVEIQSPSLCKDTSFKKAQECLSVVAKEFEMHGIELRGPSARLKKAGKNGYHIGNIARDLHRGFVSNRRDPVPPNII